MLKPVITLKNLKTMDKLSEETTCFTATVYVDGKKFVEAGNTGHGGEDRFYPIGDVTHADIGDLQNRIRDTYPQFNLAHDDEEPRLIDMDLSLVIGDLIAEDRWLKDYRRTSKTKVLFIKPDEKAIYQMPLKKTHTLAQHVAFILSKTPGAVILNEKPEAEGLALYKANVEQR